MSHNPRPALGSGHGCSGPRTLCHSEKQTLVSQLSLGSNCVRQHWAHTQEADWGQPGRETRNQIGLTAKHALWTAKKTERKAGRYQLSGRVSSDPLPPPRPLNASTLAICTLHLLLTLLRLASRSPRSEKLHKAQRGRR